MPGVGATPPAARSAEEPLTRPPQWFDTLEERTNGEVVGERLLVLSAGHPDLLPVGSVQPGVVPHNRPGRGGPACLGRADRGLSFSLTSPVCSLAPLGVGGDSHKPNRYKALWERSSPSLGQILCSTAPTREGSARARRR